MRTSTEVRSQLSGASSTHAARSLMVALLCVMSGACSTDRDPESLFAPDDVGKLVVDGLLVNDKPLPSITVTRALSPGVEYSLEAAGEAGALVQVTSEADGRIFLYDPTGQVGVYAPRSNALVLADNRYDLQVMTTAGETVTATTQTPPRLQVDQWLLLDETGQTVLRQLATYEALGDSVYFAPENQLTYAEGLLEARFVRPEVLGFQIGIFSLDPDSDFVIEPDFFEPEDYEDIERQGSSPALEVPDGELRLPWFTIFFEGRYKIRVMALDTNAIDWVRSLPADGGFNFGGLIGDNFERPIFHVEGGIGLFGSASADSVGFFVNKRPPVASAVSANPPSGDRHF